MIILMMSYPLSPASAQEAVGGWSVTIADDNGEIQSIILSESGAGSIPIIIENSGLTNIRVSLECNAPFEAQVSCPESVQVSPGSNVTVIGMMNGVDVMQHSAGSSADFEVIATVTARQGIPVAIPGDTDSDDVLIEIPAVYMLKVAIDDPPGPINAGADTILKVSVENRGNIADRASEVEVATDCTLMTVGPETAGLTNKEIQPGGEITANVVFEAALSHPSKSCDVDIQVVSQGSGGSQTSTDSTRIDVQAATGDDKPKGPVDDDSGTVEVVTTGLPSVGVFAGVVTLFLAAISTAKQRK
ncbi:MAG: hypothetical protein CMB42_03915 [Euryarchaeota archaeon]|nr:hypothetical protein [Euryarchaeota archaeon]